MKWIRLASMSVEFKSISWYYSSLMLLILLILDFQCIINCVTLYFWCNIWQVSYGDPGSNIWNTFLSFSQNAMIKASSLLSLHLSQIWVLNHIKTEGFILYSLFEQLLFMFSSSFKVNIILNIIYNIIPFCLVEYIIKLHKACNSISLHLGMGATQKLGFHIFKFLLYAKLLEFMFNIAHVPLLLRFGFQFKESRNTAPQRSCWIKKSGNF